MRPDRGRQVATLRPDEHDVPIRLYNSQVSGNCYKVRLLLAHLGIPYERVELDVVDRSNRADVLGAKNPARRVPTVELDDGRTLGESNAITWFFADGTEYLPTDPYERAQALQWLFFEQYDHEPNVAVARFWLLFERVPSEEALAERQAGGYRALDAMEAHLAARDYLVGGRYSIADIGLFAYTHVAEEGGFDLARYPAIRGWIDRVRGQPGHVPITA
jgi:glutathione S-transferase